MQRIRRIYVDLIAVMKWGCEIHIVLMKSLIDTYFYHIGGLPAIHSSVVLI